MGDIKSVLALLRSDQALRARRALAAPDALPRVKGIDNEVVVMQFPGQSGQVVERTLRAQDAPEGLYPGAAIPQYLATPGSQQDEANPWRGQQGLENWQKLDLDTKLALLRNEQAVMRESQKPTLAQRFKRWLYGE